MIGAVQGRIIEHFEGEVQIAVGHFAANADSASSWIAYQLRIPIHSRYAQLAIGSHQVFQVYTHVREDALELFGFLTLAEKKIFLLLTSVNGIGPKMALAILSAYGAEEIFQIILSGNKDALTDVSGVGKKTAERIVLELRDTISKKWSGATSANAGAVINPAAKAVPLAAQEAMIALTGLGFKENDAKQMLERALQQNPSAKTEDLVKLSLQRSYAGK